MPDVQSHRTTILAPVRRLSAGELEALRQLLPAALPYEARDPYRPIDPGAQRVPFYQPRFLLGERV